MGEWSGPCAMLAPVLEKSAAENAARMTVAKLNGDDNPATARRFQVMSIPTMSVFSGGKLVKRIIGAKPKSSLLRDLRDVL